MDCHDGSAFVVNTIIWGNATELNPDDFQISLRDSELTAYIYFHYSDIQDENPENLNRINGRSIMSQNPRFVNPDNRNYHLKSQQGRWVSSEESLVRYDLFSDYIIDLKDISKFATYWNLSSLDANYDSNIDYNLDNNIDVEDLVYIADNFLKEYDVDGFVLDSVTSPCINAGDIDARYDYSSELMENGLRINMGAYGGTDQASKSDSTDATYTLLADLDGDGEMIIVDYNIFYDFYIIYQGTQYDPETDYDGSGTVDDSDKIEFDRFDFNNDNWIDMEDDIYFNKSYGWTAPWLNIIKFQTFKPTAFLVGLFYADINLHTFFHDCLRVYVITHLNPAIFSTIKIKTINADVYSAYLYFHTIRGENLICKVHFLTFQENKYENFSLFENIALPGFFFCNLTHRLSKDAH